MAAPLDEAPQYARAPLLSYVPNVACGVRLCAAPLTRARILGAIAATLLAFAGGAAPAIAEGVAEAAAAAEGEGAAPHPDVPPPPAEPSGPVEEPSDYRMDNFRTPVPATLRGARVLGNDEAADIWNKNGAVFIDVYPQAPKPPNLPAGTFWREPVHRSLEGAHWLPNVGYGALSPAMDAYFRGALEKLAKGKRETPLVFFCLKDCWMSWNAAKRALAYGYTNVMWFRDGTDGWQELGYPLAEVKKLP
jgi:PQQ-dependent catabolism-associated CXXCW motif protein